MTDVLSFSYWNVLKYNKRITETKSFSVSKNELARIFPTASNYK